MGFKDRSRKDLEKALSEAVGLYNEAVRKRDMDGKVAASGTIEVIRRILRRR